MSLLATKSLTKQFDGVYAVNDLSLSFESGKVTGIVGPNGSGKSTLVNILTGMLPISSGAIVFGSDVERTRIKASDVPNYGMTRTFQDVRLFEQMTALDNVLVVLTSRSSLRALFEKDSPLHREVAERVLKQVGLSDKHEHLAHSLSYGQRKLLEIARMLAMVERGNVTTIFFDEPFAGLFPRMIETVVSVMKELREQGKAVVLIEHNMELIRELSDTLYVLDAGTLLAEGDPEQVLARKDVIEAYLGE